VKVPTLEEGLIAGKKVTPANGTFASLPRTVGTAVEG